MSAATKTNNPGGEELRVFEGSRVFEEHGEAWGAFLDQVPSPFFLRPDWLASWARHFGAGRRHFLAVLERDGEWLAGLPLTLGRGRVGGRWMVSKLEAAGMPYFDRMEVAARDPRWVEPFLISLIDWACSDRKVAWTAFALQEVPNASPTHQALRLAAAARGFALYEQLASRAPMVDLETGGKTSSKYRRQLRQSLEQLAEQGEVECRFFFPETTEIDPLILDCKRVEDRSWKGEQGVGMFREGEPLSFVRELWRELCPRRELALATFRVNGRLLIYHWGFIHRDRFLSYNLAQHPSTDRKRGGSVLLKYMVDHGRELGIRVIDASRGSLESPNIIGRYHGPIRSHGNLLLYAPGSTGKCLEFLRHVMMPRIRRIRHQQEPPRLPSDESFVD